MYEVQGAKHGNKLVGVTPGLIGAQSNAYHFEPL